MEIVCSLLKYDCVVDFVIGSIVWCDVEASIKTNKEEVVRLEVALTIAKREKDAKRKKKAWD